MQHLTAENVINHVQNALGWELRIVLNVLMDIILSLITIMIYMRNLKLITILFLQLKEKENVFLTVKKAKDLLMESVISAL